MSVPLLDNIETSGTAEKTAESLTHNDISDVELSINDLTKYRNLTVETALSLLEFGVYSDWRLRGNDLLNCGSSLAFHNDKLVSANFCRLRVCPMCQRRKSLKTYADFKKIVSTLNDYAFLHLVLTVPNVSAEELRLTVENMNKSSTRLFAHSDIKKAFKGVARFLEVSYNSRTDSYHPHFHCLVCVSRSYFTSRYYLSHNRIRFLWSVLWKLHDDNLKRISDKALDSFVLSDTDFLQVHIKRADPDVLPEIAKYCVKPLELSLSREVRGRVIQTLFEALHNKRLLQTYGIFRGYSFGDDECCDDATFDINDIARYNYDYSLSRYVRDN